MQKDKTQKNTGNQKGIIKRFLEWIGLKEKIHNNDSVIRVLSSSRMYGIMGKLGDNDTKKIKNGFLRLYS